MADNCYIVWVIKEGYAEEGLTPRMVTTHKYFLRRQDAEKYFDKEQCVANEKKNENSKSRKVQCILRLIKCTPISYQQLKWHPKLEVPVDKKELKKSKKAKK